MLLTKNDIENGFTAAVSAGRIPDFVQHFDEGGGLIYGIGGAISECWTAYELYGQKSARVRELELPINLKKHGG